MLTSPATAYGAYRLPASVDKTISDGIEDHLPASGSKSTHASAPADVAPSSVAPSLSLSPDALMAYCSSRLQSIDSQMSEIMQTQQTNATSTTAVDNVAAALNQLPAPTGNPPMIQLTGTPGAPNYNQVVSAAYVAALAAVPPNSSLHAALETDFVAFENDMKNGQISPDDVSQLSQNLKNDASNLNSDSEMIMINLQSLMSQRQTAVQLTTNLVQALGDQANAIAKNIGQ
jgi:hypothetical protein